VCCRGEGEQDNFVLFLDADEIIDSDRMIPWLQSGVTAEYDVIEFAAYEYGTDPTTQLLQLNHAGLLIRRSFVQRGFLLHADDRYFYKDPVVFPADNARIRLMGVHELDGEPLVHHYSFARPSQQHLKRKVLLSGHFEDSQFGSLNLTGLFGSRAEEEKVKSKGLDAVLTDNDLVLRIKPDTIPWRVVAPFVDFRRGFNNGT
jgi:hypothetical protein